MVPDSANTAVPTEKTLWVEQLLRGLVLGAPENRLSDFGGRAIFDAPIVGMADGDDPLFAEFRRVVSPDHLLPREVLRQHSGADAHPAAVRVISWVLPFTEAVRRSNRRRDRPSRLYSLARCNGGALSFKVRRQLTEDLRRQGYCAVAPLLTEEYQAYRCIEHTFSSSWSERHVAYAAGLGRFGLNGCLITSLGASVRLGSVITNLPVQPTPRPGKDHRAPCLETAGTACGECMERCPVGAISERGLDKEKCYRMRGAIRKRFLESYVSTLHMLPAPVGGRASGYSLGCALCQHGVPCERAFPESHLGREGQDA